MHAICSLYETNQYQYLAWRISYEHIIWYNKSMTYRTAGAGKQIWIYVALPPLPTNSISEEMWK